MAMKSSRLVAAAVLVAASLLDPALVSAEVVKPHYRKVAPGFTLSDAKRAPITLSDFKGKVVLLDFWATWCAASKVEMPWYVEFESRYRNSGLAIIGVSMDDEGWAIVSSYLEGRPVTYPIVLGDHDVADRFGLASLPVTLLIDRNGKVAAKHFGLVDKADVENEIRKLLKERPKNTKNKKKS
jgi:thiol-disulfide isomerase/thioredoxin